MKRTSKEGKKAREKSKGKKARKKSKGKKARKKQAKCDCGNTGDK
jgi:hypothetical protein